MPKTNASARLPLAAIVTILFHFKTKHMFDEGSLTDPATLCIHNWTNWTLTCG